MSYDRDKLLAEAREKFRELSSVDSPVRRLSEAVRENDADEYDSSATIDAFEKSLDKSAARLGEVAQKFKSK